MAPTRYDFVIVGGGSAGCAVANRLSADPGNRVLVLEAGRNDSLWDVFVHMTAALPFPIGSRFYDWKYESEPEPHMDGRRIYHARGRPAQPSATPAPDPAPLLFQVEVTKNRSSRLSPRRGSGRCGPAPPWP
jgi:choline dehydrogenase-like flavoprotein